MLSRVQSATPGATEAPSCASMVTLGTDLPIEKIVSPPRTTTTKIADCPHCPESPRRLGTPARRTRPAREGTERSAIPGCSPTSPRRRSKGARFPAYRPRSPARGCCGCAARPTGSCRPSATARRGPMRGVRRGRDRDVDLPGVLLPRVKQLAHDREVLAVAAHEFVRQSVRLVLLMRPGVPGVGDQPGGRPDLIFEAIQLLRIMRSGSQPELPGYLTEEQPLTTTTPHGRDNVVGEASQRRKSGLALPAESPWRALRAGFAICSLVSEPIRVTIRWKNGIAAQK
jgi:hypothetical protein